MAFRLSVFAILSFLALPALAVTRPPVIHVVPVGTRAELVTNMAFVTNRSVIPLEHQTESTATFFQNSPTSELKYGLAEFTIHGAQHVRGKSDGAISIFRHERLSEQAFLSLDKGSEELIFVHGFNASFDGSVKQAALLKHDLAAPMPFVAYCWASDGSALGYHPDRWDIDDNARAMAEFLVRLLSARAPGSVNLLVYSLGNEVFLSAIDLLDRQGQLTHLHFGKIILTAADVSQARFRVIVPKLLRSSRRVVQYVSTKDLALYLSGHVANPLDGVRAGASIVEIPGLEIIDVDAVNDSKVSFGHGYFAASLPILKDIAAILADRSDSMSPEARMGSQAVRAHTTSGFGYWKFLSR